MSVLVGKPAPDFTATAVVNEEFRELTLSAHKGHYIILYFYPLDFTFVCPTEIVKFNTMLDEFKKRNVEVIGVSIDSHFSHLAWIKTAKEDGGLGGLDYPLVSDLSKQIARDYDVLTADGTVAYRGLFLIDKDGIVRHQVVNDLPLGRNIAEALRMVDALQFFESHGEACPADWQEGSATIKPDPEGSKEYFQNHHK